jgi:hypothetical protein
LGIRDNVHQFQQLIHHHEYGLVGVAKIEVFSQPAAIDDPLGHGLVQQMGHKGQPFEPRSGRRHPPIQGFDWARAIEVGSCNKVVRDLQRNTVGSTKKIACFVAYTTFP